MARLYVFWGCPGAGKGSLSSQEIKSEGWQFRGRFKLHVPVFPLGFVNGRNAGADFTHFF